MALKLFKKEEIFYNELARLIKINNYIKYLSY